MNQSTELRARPGVKEETNWLRLRILATSDLHGAVLPHDYATDRDGGAFGLARVATLIEAARRDAPGACLLLDNGDFLQGTALADLAMSEPLQGPHPMIEAMNRLGYDVAGLGNHEFNFGLAALQRVLADARFPVICANALTRRGRTVAVDATLLRPAHIIEKHLTDAAGKPHLLRIGVLSVVPPQIVTWDRSHLERRVVARDMIETVAARVPMLRMEGADLVVLLAHTGIENGPAGEGTENAALALAGLPGVDAIIAGHSHGLFPLREQTAAPQGADHVTGTLRGVPAVMPGHHGTHLGVIDLTLAPTGRGWRVVAHDARLQPVAPENGLPPPPAAPAIIKAAHLAHQATRSRLDRPLGSSPWPIHSYLSRYRSDLPVLIVAAAQRRAVSRALAFGPYAHLPVLAATPPYRTGGRGGPQDYTDIPAGPLTLRNALDLTPFPDALCALRLTGSELRDWLERAASCYLTIRPGLPDQPLWDPRFPGHSVDTIAGLSYRIDLTRPPLYDADGRRRAGTDEGRIRDLAHLGRPVADDAEFAVAMSSFRAAGGGPYPSLPRDRVIHESNTPARDALIDFLRQGGLTRFAPRPVWSFLPVPGASAQIGTGPGLRRHPGEILALGLTDLGLSPAGFLRLRLPLFTTACATVP